MIKIAVFSSLFSRLLTSAPLITDNALLVLKRYCQDEVRSRVNSFFRVNEFVCFADSILFGNEYPEGFNLSSAKYA